MGPDRRISWLGATQSPPTTRKRSRKSSSADTVTGKGTLETFTRTLTESDQTDFIYRADLIRKFHEQLRDALATSRTACRTQLYTELFFFIRMYQSLTEKRTEDPEKHEYRIE